MPDETLSYADHSRDAAGLTYVYPVVSRRAGGLSIGINLNPNNACNWRCVYCQVPGLTLGTAPAVDLNLLHHELAGFLEQVVDGDYLARHVPDGLRRLNDIALSGNGEPTSAREFDQVIALVGEMLAASGLAGKTKLVLITNGSLTHRPEVQRGLAAMAGLNGEVWFKLDRATEAGIAACNSVHVNLASVKSHLQTAARLCPTWLQTCVFSMDGMPPGDDEAQAYLDLLAEILASGGPLQGVMLYGLARPSTQPEAARLGNVPAQWTEGLAARIRQQGLPVRISL